MEALNMNTSLPSPIGYQTVTWLSQLPERLQNRAKNAKFFPRVTNQLASYATDHDYREFQPVGKTSLPSPPKGVFIALLFGVASSSRMFRAWQRGRERHDYREVWDVARRDMSTMTLILFALEPFTKQISKLVQRMTKVPLLDTKENKLLSYSQLKNYRMNTPQVIQALLTEGHGSILQKSLKQFDPALMPEQIAKSFKQFSKSIDELVGKTDRSTIEQDCKKAFKHLSEAENARKTFISTHSSHAMPAIKKQVKYLQNEFGNAMVQLTQKHRLPADITSFAIVAVLTGWFPVWFNAQWNKRQFQQKQEQSTTKPDVKPSAPKSILPQQTAFIPQNGGNAFVQPSAYPLSYGLPATQTSSYPQYPVLTFPSSVESSSQLNQPGYNNAG
jgi:hypothetical protein